MVGAGIGRESIESCPVIIYRDDVTGIQPGQFTGFFEGWLDAPSPETHLRVLQGSAHVVLAIDADQDRVVGFVTAYIPLLEVLPAYRKQGIGSELMRRILARLEALYMVDLMCDPELQPYYRQFGMQPSTGMVLRNRAHQSGV
jgi:ribosomal protein S18 acetylase RimI-like enzyme